VGAVVCPNSQRKHAAGARVFFKRAFLSENDQILTQKASLLETLRKMSNQKKLGKINRTESL
jgi:hypothetical protein